MGRALRYGLVAALVFSFNSKSAFAADAEQRTFNVTVDGKPSGTYKFARSVAADGSETIAAVADVKVRVLLITYIYTLNSVEVWKNGKLVSVAASSNNDGKKSTVTVRQREDGLDLTINGKSKKLDSAAHTSTGWKLPSPTDKARDILLFDTDDATETPVKFEPLGPYSMTLNGQKIEGQRYKLTGKKVNSEWWHDAKGRPVQILMNWDGHKVAMDLAEVK
jgi:hypothetical protein